MSDARVRELERRFKETGAVLDEAAWLRARVQAGDLTEERLALAAYAGHPAARLAVGERAPPLPASERWADLAEWVRGFRAWERPLGLRVMLAAVEASWAHWAPHFEPPDAETIEGWLAAGRAWAECPCDEHAAAARALRDHAVEAIPRRGGHVIDAAFGVLRMASGDDFWSGAVGNARNGPQGRVTGEVLARIRTQVGGWLLQ